MKIFLRLEDLQNVFYGENLKKSSTEIFNGGLQRVFYVEKDFVSSNKEKIPSNRQTEEKSFKKSSMKRVLLKCLLWKEGLGKFFYGENTLKGLL